MIVELGAFALILALVLSVLQAGMAAAGRLRRSPVLAGAAEGAALACAGVVALGGSGSGLGELRLEVEHLGMRGCALVGARVELDEEGAHRLLPARGHLALGEVRAGGLVVVRLVPRHRSRSSTYC